MKSFHDTHSPRDHGLGPPELDLNSILVVVVVELETYTAGVDHTGGSH
jgi:hypothetical protein